VLRGVIILKKLISILGGLVFTLALVTTVSAAPNWDVSGTWIFDYNDGVMNLHDMTLVQDGVGGLTGYGGAFSGALIYTYPWVIDTGLVDGNSIIFTAHYTATVTCSFTATGTIAPAGTMSGTWTDNCAGNRNGTWATTIGTAKAIVVATCPAKTVPTLLETKIVPSNSPIVTSSTSVLLNGKNYLLISSGTWQNRDMNVADTEYTSINAWSTIMDGYNISPWFLGEGEFDLQVDSAFINWGAYDSTHTYSHLYTGTGSLVNFLIFDGNFNTGVLESGWYSDNTGSLTVNIYSCDPERINLPTNKDQCKKDGWKTFGVFKNQGDCVSFVTTGGKNPPALLP
jgi:hypothetical protein